MLFSLAYFVGKKAMFSLDENNRIVMTQHPADMRIGDDRMFRMVTPRRYLARESLIRYTMCSMA